jgi:hypothetical protein
MTTNTEALPPPYGYITVDMRGNSVEWRGYTADQMRAYAAEAVRATLAHPQTAPAAQPMPATDRCAYCDDTGDVTSITGEWRGYCYCPAGKLAATPPQADQA